MESFSSAINNQTIPKISLFPNIQKIIQDKGAENITRKRHIYHQSLQLYKNDVSILIPRNLKNETITNKQNGFPHINQDIKLKSIMNRIKRSSKEYYSPSSKRIVDCRF